jgi:Superinfection immunity protein/Protein of unknown function (DUF2510)
MILQATLPPPTTSHLSANEKAGIALFVVIVVTLYFLPTIIAAIRRVPGIGSIVVFNTLLGWTMFWWVFSLASAFQHVERTRRVAAPPPVGAVAVAAGWYRDPINASRLRYHDSRHWTDAVAEPPYNARWF